MPPVPRRALRRRLSSVLWTSLQIVLLAATPLALERCTHGSESHSAGALLSSQELGPLLDKVVARTLDPKEGGATVDLRTGQLLQLGSSHIAVSRAGGIALPAVAPPSRLAFDLQQFVKARRELIEPNHYLGTWQDVQEKLVYYDVTVLFPYTDASSRQKALGLANAFGVRERQKTIYDLGSGKTYVVEAGKAGGELTEM